MRILFLSQVLPYPLDAGPKIRSYYVLRHLAQQHEVTLLTFVRDTDRPEDIEHLAQFCHRIHTIFMQRHHLNDIRFLMQSMVTGQPFLILRDQVKAMTAKVQALVREESFDVVHADQLWMAQYAEIAKRACTDLKLILDQHNAVHLIPQRLADSEPNPVKRQFFKYEASQLRRYETATCQQFDHVVWVTEEDRQAVTALSVIASDSSKPSTIIPICVAPAQNEQIASSHYRPHIIFLGGLHWPPNAQGILWFKKEIFPLVRAEVPEATLTVIGKNPPAELRGDHIEVTGYVSNLMPFLAETCVFIVPLRAGGGMRVKILDAWNWGLPVVSTTVGAEGLQTQAGKNILMADTPQSFATAVIRVLQDRSLAYRLSQCGYQTVTEQYDWHKTYTAWDDVYQTTANGTQQ